MEGKGRGVGREGGGREDESRDGEGGRKGTEGGDGREAGKIPHCLMMK